MNAILSLASAFAVLVAGAPAFAQSAQAKEIMTCSVPVQTGTSVVSLNASIQSDLSNDFILVGLNDKGTMSRLFNQAKKGETEAKLATGSFSMLLLEENFAQDSGVIRNAGLISISKNETGLLSGILIAKGNIYPLSCTAK